MQKWPFSSCNRPRQVARKRHKRTDSFCTKPRPYRAPFSAGLLQGYTAAAPIIPRTCAQVVEVCVLCHCMNGAEATYSIQSADTSRARCLPACLCLCMAVEVSLAEPRRFKCHKKGTQQKFKLSNFCLCESEPQNPLLGSAKTLKELIPKMLQDLKQASRSPRS